MARPGDPGRDRSRSSQAPPPAGRGPRPADGAERPVVRRRAGDRRAHHGSVSKDQQALIEDELKRGVLPCVVATSSLELGIDMGAVDLVVQIESRPASPPPCSASAARATRSARCPAGCCSPSATTVHTAVAVERMHWASSRCGSANPLDVLAQQVVAATATDEWDADDLFDLVRQAASF